MIEGERIVKLKILMSARAMAVSIRLWIECWPYSRLAKCDCRPKYIGCSHSVWDQSETKMAVGLVFLRISKRGNVYT